MNVALTRSPLNLMVAVFVDPPLLLKIADARSPEKLILPLVLPPEALLNVVLTRSPLKFSDPLISVVLLKTKLDEETSEFALNVKFPI